jgi:hypothetical protein
MKTGALPTNFSREPLWIALGVLTLLTGAELAAILILNSGMFVFTLDDPYIHLALAENILNGHYGVNALEPSAPSSSIVWPFLLAPFSTLTAAPIIVLVLNFVASAATLYFFLRILGPGEKGVPSSTIAFALSAVILCTNLIGLMFTGMEHSLQVMLSVAIVFGIVREIETDRLSFWLLAVIVAAPLVRYECLAISLPALLFLFVRGYRLSSFLTGVVLVACLAAFGLFLSSLGLDPFPTSILAKSSIVGSGGGVASFVGTLKNGLQSGRGVLLVISLILLLCETLDKRRPAPVRWFAFSGVLAIAMHLIAGSYGWYSRYEIYMWAAALAWLTYIYKDRIYSFFDEFGFIRAAAVSSVAVCLVCAPYLYALATTPVASNNIYEQHFQMHRFAKEYWRGAVAVNDLGWVAYQNENYVLDLGGLASAEALRLRLSVRDSDAEWMERMTLDKGVKVAMIYDEWFRGVPNSWIKVGTLSLGMPKVTPAGANVSFYATDCTAYKEVLPKVEAFSRSVPVTARFTILDRASATGCGTELDLK